MLYDISLLKLPEDAENIVFGSSEVHTTLIVSGTVHAYIKLDKENIAVH